MMPTDLVSVAPAGRDMTAPEANLASVVEARWHERSPRSNHCTLSVSAPFYAPMQLSAGMG
jgi:hypothetical protein